MRNLRGVGYGVQIVFWRLHCALHLHLKPVESLRRHLRCSSYMNDDYVDHHFFSMFWFTLSFFAFFFFSLAFLPLRSLFFKPPMPTLHTSAYFAKNPSKSSACTTVDNLILSSRLSPDFPLVARIMIGRGRAGCKSGKGEEGGRGVSVAFIDRSGGDTGWICLSQKLRLPSTGKAYVVSDSDEWSHGLLVDETRKERIGDSQTAKPQYSLNSIAALYCTSSMLKWAPGMLDSTRVVRLFTLNPKYYCQHEVRGMLKIRS